MSSDAPQLDEQLAGRRHSAGASSEENSGTTAAKRKAATREAPSKKSEEESGSVADPASTEPVRAGLDDPAGDVSDESAPGYVDATEVELEARGEELRVRVQVSEDLPESMPNVTTALGVAVFLEHPDGGRTSLLAYTTKDGWLLKVDKGGRQENSEGSATPLDRTLELSVPIRELQEPALARWSGSISYVAYAGTPEQSEAYDRFPDEGEAAL